MNGALAYELVYRQAGLVEALTISLQLVYIKPQLEIWFSHFSQSTEVPALEVGIKVIYSLWVL